MSLSPYLDDIAVFHVKAVDLNEICFFNLPNEIHLFYSLSLAGRKVILCSKQAMLLK